ncbi:hypothetical protein WA026_017599 [Henosepilachna vigintioctopunctata]|uniref:Uncharacterized protein n=1 Tax=Henosepilachna vigintioctopunctata TaxID=420089 RepID=A0AAW1V484_9CUCU
MHQIYKSGQKQNHGEIFNWKSNEIPRSTFNFQTILVKSESTHIFLRETERRRDPSSFQWRPASVEFGHRQRLALRLREPLVSEALETPTGRLKMKKSEKKIHVWYYNGIRDWRVCDVCSPARSTPVKSPDFLAPLWNFNDRV